MPYIEWNDALNTNVAEIDAQHRKLIDMLNELYEVANTPGQAATALKVVNEMKTYALTHFSTEEALMNKYKYPGAFDHLAQHASFVSKIKALEAKNSKDPDFFMVVIKFLKQWLVEHISNMDIKMGRYFQERV